ncbi:hypothetical protein ACHHZC_07205 [Citrobacter freundii complex sp. 2024EL-00228]|uniref:Uncharacterized protein n=5 Tax=Enterobacteriaceae TaxID=543 RepID=A0A5U3ARU8_SALER|nr:MULTISPECIES: hypothetical protein [Enterobacteriaceae]EAA4494931.1 hypothetical protein [Salmonella enterica subsp. enterica serovar Cubana]EAA7603347.1 hypothetical protein [Salmonella enterica subsp. enterica]EBD0150946.1 hypothetical protein [Salmonella enterica subsp. enterica serovar Coeln]EBD3352869.1 hypothetical protein [Salmonella enterica subsp. enterica serovar Kentucky]EBF2801098.1 hypothetical protein [Salmonella enterica subsp. enterica serovar Altona]EBM9969409.1 hypothetic
MIKALTALSLMLVSTITYSASKVIYLECPNFDERAKDLVVVLDQPNGTASLQTSFGGEGLNFTAPASFGPSKVTWRRDEKNWKRNYSVDRSTLEFKREVYSLTFNDTMITKTSCKIIKSPNTAKF